MATSIPKIEEISLRQLSLKMENYVSHRQLTELFTFCRITDAAPNLSRKDRMFATFMQIQNIEGCSNNIFNFIAKVADPRRFEDTKHHEAARKSINEALLFLGFEIAIDGSIITVKKATTVEEAKTRSSKIKHKVHGVSVHNEVIRFCEEEWLRDNYFHAILEITKSVAQSLRTKSGYQLDGSELVDACFALGSSNQPMLAFNSLVSQSDQSEHKGFSNFCKGFFGMYRNPKAHDPKIHEDTQLEELFEVIVIATIIHKRLDKTFKTGYK